MRGAYCSVSARYCPSAVAASAVRSGRTPGKAWPESKAMFPGGAAAGRVGDNCDARRAKAGGCIDAPADENVFVRTISTGHIYGWRESGSSAARSDVILRSEATKDLVSANEQQILRFAQDDTSLSGRQALRPTLYAQRSTPNAPLDPLCRHP